MLISLKNVDKTFKDGKVVALENISLDIRAGEFVSLVGPSGCGKTTLLRLINGLITPDAGQVLYKGKAPSPEADMAMVFQSARLLPWKSVAENITFVLGLRGMARKDRLPRAQALLGAVGLRDFADAFPHELSGGMQQRVGLARGMARKDRLPRAQALLGAVGLRDFADAFPHELSGGMQQRVGLARALAVEPEVLLMDEPFAALDAMTRETLRAELARMWARRRMAVVFVTHDIDEAILLSQRIVMLKPRPGRIDTIVDVDLPEARWDGDIRASAAFTSLRAQLWDRIHGMAGDGAVLEELARAFDDTP
ncbi:ABC-type nitrate/sulfonate/bicarbonate transport system ATPase component [Ketogulonicigenium vulgare Y25]|uniref:ABC transporter ATP-binding protein n=1 Tax=Ketogulonicigenium vulgare TaxID=92945 RepID=UPI0001E67288|nr:ABC transporter ATP-binding protein [Ketogulonicigenium vulgare]ADO42554.1 ABC-type nitrate/sulfonate/bicarbonate transport system ATPase component [Ketogulonicigenium vulgare Y25]